jgi:hypothetical protein
MVRQPLILDVNLTDLYKRDKARAALSAIRTTIGDARHRKMHRSFIDALLEAERIIRPHVKGEAKMKKMRPDMLGSVALELLIRDKVKLNDALKVIVGDDEKAASRLLNFRKNMRAGRNATAKVDFDYLMKLFRSSRHVQKVLEMRASAMGERDKKV